MTESVTVTWGGETFQLAQYMSVSVGPFSVTTAVQKGETTAQAMTRAEEVVRSFATKAFEQKLAEHRTRLGQSRQK